ncbi:MAG: 16S rRNA (cytidine(1402)-2'-O)-methyltransferase [Pseudomonadota bacterium]
MADESKRTGLRGPDPAPSETPLPPGLYLVATPIGNAGDIALRAIDVLARADVVAAEDTRRLRTLFQIHDIDLGHRPLISYHDRNGAARRPQILGWLAEGRSVALVSDAGTPLVADPGYRLVQGAIEGGHGLTAVPGASAPLVALALSGLPSDRFLFGGFLPPKTAARRTELAELAPVPATLVLFESPQRVAAALGDMAAVLGDRPAAVARELTKRFEEVRRGTLAGLAEAYAQEPAPKGEIVVVIGPPLRDLDQAEGDLDTALDDALSRLSLKDAVAEVSATLGLPRKRVYARALERREP